MGGPARLVINGTPGQQLDLGGIAGQVHTLLEDLEARYSRYRAESIVSVINQHAGSGVFTELDPKPKRYSSWPAGYGMRREAFLISPRGR